MSVITVGGICRRCRITASIRDNDPFCWSCMEEVKRLEEEAKWDYMPKGVDPELWKQACEEVKDL